METLARHFDTALDTPDGIKKLRELILSLAMKGKLVPQDAKDQPASELLKEIEKEKARLVKEGKIKKQESLLPIKPEEIPYELPNGWEWCYLENICALITDGTHHTPTYTVTGIPFISVKDLSSGYLDFSNTKYISIEEHKELIKRCHPEKDDILLTKIGTTGIALTINTTKDFSIFVSVALLKLLNKFVFPEFITKLINSPLVKNYSKEGTEGVGNKNLVLRKIQSFIIPLPPLTEQKRIVEKIDQLMSLCDKLESERNKRDNKRISVHTAAVNNLLSASDKPAFDKSWSFITKNFNELYSVTPNVVELKKAILQLAVMGKLVSQDKNDQSAGELLKEIEKDASTRLSARKKMEPLPPIKPEEIPYQIPEGWVWCRLNDVFDVRDGTHDTPKYIESGIPLITSKNFKDGEIDFESAKLISEKDHKEIKQRSFVEKHDILFSMIGGNIGNMVMVNTDREFSIKNVALFKYYNRKLTSPDYLMLYLKHVSYSIQEKAAGGAQPFVSLTFLRNHLFPLPPLAEQKRIVAKIDQLMELCNSLEQGIKVATEKRSRVLGAVLARV